MHSTRRIVLMVAFAAFSFPMLVGAQSPEAGKGQSPRSFGSPTPTPSASSGGSSPVADAARLLDQYNGSGDELAQAAKLLEAATTSDPSNPALYVELSRLQMKRFGLSSETLKQCETWLRKSIELDPNFGNGYVLLGYVLTHQFQSELAEKALDRAVELSADSPWLHMNRGELFAKQQRVIEAIAEYMQVAETPTIAANIRAHAQEALARLLAVGQDPKAAMAAYAKALSLQPNNAWVMGNYSRFLRVSMLNVAESERWARRALDKMRFGFAEESLGATLYLKWAERRAAGAGKAELDALWAEAKQLLRDPAEILREIDGYPRAHPIIAALAATGVSLDHYPGVQVGVGTSPLVAVIGRRNRAIVEALLGAGADVNAPGYQGGTPLIVAAYLGDDDLVKLLLVRGADPHLMTSDSEDAEATALQQSHASTAALLAAAKRSTPAVGRGAGVATAPVIGARYRVVRDVVENGWTMATFFKVGTEFVYRGPCTLMNGNGEPVRDHHCYFYRKDGALGDDTWAIKKDAPNQWGYYVEPVLPVDK